MRVFLDFEASSLNSKFSFPVEVGWVLEDGSGEGHLIRPAPHWTDWDPSAEVMHGLSRAVLEREGEDVAAVCDRVVDLFAGNMVYCSAPSWDGHWLSMLLRAAGRPRHLLRMLDTEVAFEEAARQRLASDDEAAIAELVAQARTEAAAWPVTHRAEADARREWRIWQRILGTSER
ncbi:MAG TPA: transcriptional regulator [Devosia sp.]